MSQSKGNYLRVTEWKVLWDAKGLKNTKEKMKQYHYRRMVSGGAEELSRIDNFLNWKSFEKFVPYQGNYRVIACKKCDPITGSPQYYKVIIKDKERLFYKIEKGNGIE